MKKVSIIIVNWNGIFHLRKCLPGLNKINYPNFEIIVVDNASTDGSIEYIKKNYPKIKIIVNKKNLGFAGGNNVGYKKTTGDYILFLNNDTTVTNNFVTKLVNKIGEDSRYAGVQAKILSMDNNNRLDSVGAFLTNTGFLYHYGYYQLNKKSYDKIKLLYTAKGACMLFRRAVIESVGLFDGDFFAYFEETDFCHRVWLAGYTIGYAPEAIIYHKIGGTSNNMNNAFIQFHSFKNRINSYIKNLGPIELIKILPLHLLLCEIAAIIFIIRNRFDLFIGINKAIYWNIRNIKNTLRKRRIIQTKIRKIKDKDLMTIIKRNPPVRYYYYLFAKSLIGYYED